MYDEPYRCRMCKGQLHADAVLTLEGMPKAAQYYPEIDEFSEDHGIELAVYQCRDCGLVQLIREPVSYFKEVITAASISGAVRKWRLEQMSHFIGTFDLAGKTILEVGAGKGEMLDVIEEAGASAIGLEASENSVAIGLSSGRSLINGYIGDQGILFGERFSGFVSLNYLEHVPEPGLAIKRIYDYTTDDAVGFVTVPNLDFLLEEKCYYEFVADHLSYFTEKTLQIAFETHGFDVIESSTINNENDIQIIVRKQSPLNLFDNFKEVDRLCQQLRSLVEGYIEKEKRIAVWGAGHRTLALLGLSKVKGVEYVVDSARFKQGRYTPTLHSEIVPPSRLVSHPVDLIIVMVPGIYPDEVLKTIDEMKLSANVAVNRGNHLTIL